MPTRVSGSVRSTQPSETAVAAMVAIALVVNEDDAEVRAFRDGIGQIAAVHVGVAARLQHQRAAQMIGVLLEPRAPLDDGLAGHLRQPARDDTKRFAARVHFDRADHAV